MLQRHQEYYFYVGLLVSAGEECLCMQTYSVFIYLSIDLLIYLFSNAGNGT
jgi:hypothetical protein